MNNLFANLPVSQADEWFEPLAAGRSFRLERIVSHGHASAPGFWYDQPQDEWVVLLRGHARLTFESEDAPRELRPGDFVHIRAHERHRVEETAADEPTIWLAIHYEP